MKVLICNVNPSQEGFFVPIIFGMLKSFCDQYDPLRTAYTWLDPVMIPTVLDDLDEEYDFKTIDVLGISCYQWNYSYQYELGKRIKKANPDCTVIAGGPQVEWKDRAFFSKHPYIDFAVPAEGEAPFRDILFARLDHFGDLPKLEGALVNPAYGLFEYRIAPPIDLKAKPSPWLSMKDFWIRYFKRNSYYHLAAAIETSRGCPYTCTYCDWGSKTNLRVRQIPIDIAKEEIDFVVGTLKPWFMFWNDANLGIAGRDVELAERFSQKKIQSGFPLWLYYNNDKSSWRSNLRIAASFRGAGLLTKYVLSLQHLDKEVLAAIERKNLPEKDVRILVRELDKIDYPIFTQLIAGCPGDTFEKWITAFSDLMEMGVHAEYRVYPFSLLPNSTAGSEAYRAEWKIKSIERPDFVAYYFLKGSSLNWALSSSKYVVETSSYTREDYKKMWLFTWMVQALHDHGITRLVAIALYNNGSVSYKEFYRALCRWLYETEEARFISQQTIDHIERWLTDPNATLLKHNESIDGMVEPEEDLVFRIVDNLETFFDALGGLLKKRLSIPQDLLDYQRDILYQPNSNPEKETTVALSKRWVDYFVLVEKDPFKKHPWPSAEPNYTEHQIDTSYLKFPVRPWFYAEDPIKRRKAYYDQVIQHNVPGKRRTIFKIVY